MKSTRILVPLAVLLVAGSESESRLSEAVDFLVDTVKEFASLVDLPSTMYFPDDVGQPQEGTIDGKATAEPVEETDVLFRLYTRDGPTEGILLVPGNDISLNNSLFKAWQPTYVICHGYYQSSESNAAQAIKQMYIAYGQGNVVVVDWSKIANNPLYYIVKLQSVQVGQFLAAFIAFLVNKAGVDVSDVHLIGHSLGGHAVGIAGKNIRIILGKKVGRITGLDPSGILYSVEDKQNRLDRDDADFVDVIHTCGGLLGFLAPIGHADFYPNGGTNPQPGCPFQIGMLGVCSHGRSWEFYAESVNSRSFAATACSSYLEYKRDNCIESAKVPMGHYTPNTTTGMYYLRTSVITPFALG